MLYYYFLFLQTYKGIINSMAIKLWVYKGNIYSINYSLPALKYKIVIKALTYRVIVNI